MPATVKFSQQFYDRFGHAAVDELVSWFNTVDATYRSDLRELNELNFARFDAKLEQRAAQLDAKIEQRIAELRAEIRLEVAELRGEMRQGFTAVDAKLNALRSDIVKWNFVFWATTALAVIGLYRR